MTGTWKRPYPHFARLIFWHIFVRLSSLFLVTTEFVPDEGWQSLEVAHVLVFGKGYLTWEWKYGLRSYLYPWLISIPIQCLAWLGLDTPLLLVTVPRIFQLALTILAEQLLYIFVNDKYGQRTANFTIGTMWFTWFVYFTAGRTLTNSTEMALNLIAFFFVQKRNPSLMVIFIGLNFIIRPTALVYWLSLLPEVYTVVIKSKKVFMKAFITGLIILILNTGIDAFFYKELTFPWWKFFKFNFVDGKSAEFGTHPWYWYFYSGIPSVMGPNVFVLLIALTFWPPRYQAHFRIIFMFLFIFSMVPHKEIRFLLPLIPHFSIIVGDVWANITYLVDNTKKYKRFKRLTYTCIACTLSAHVFAAVFFSSYHQSGIWPACKYVNQEARKMTNPNIWIFMPCYSFPVHTYLHHGNASYEFFTCAPPGLEFSSPNFQPNAFTELDLSSWIHTKLPNPNDPTTFHPPDFVLMYEYSTSKVLNTLRNISNLNYKICRSEFHSYFPFDSVGTQVDVLCKMYPKHTLSFADDELL